MKNSIFYIPFLLLITSCISLKEKRESKLINKGIYTDTLLINLELDKDSIFNQVEAKYEIDLCKEAKNFTAILPIENNNKQVFDLTVFKRCYPFTPGYQVEILLTENNKIRVNREYVNNTDSMSQHIIDYLKLHFINKDITRIQLLFDWESQTNNALIIKAFTTSINAIKTFSNYKTHQIFGKKIKDLNTQEFEELQAKFKIQIGLTDAIPDIPDYVNIKYQNWSYSMPYSIPCNGFELEYNDCSFLKDTSITDISNVNFIKSEFMRIKQTFEPDTIFSTHPLIKCYFKIDNQSKTICVGTTEFVIIDNKAYEAKKLAKHIQKLVWKEY